MIAAGAATTPAGVSASARPARSTVAVPRLAGVDLSRGYGRIHRAGLRVALTRSFSTGDLPSSCARVIAAADPVAGRRVRRGSVVRLELERRRCGAGSPAVPTGALRSARVPDFVGRRMSVAVAWTHRHHLYFQALALPPLSAGGAATLLDNYVVTKQAPRPGARLALGIGRRSGATSSFRPTPLRLRGRLTGR